jgi:hypothetical protein
MCWIRSCRHSEETYLPETRASDLRKIRIAPVMSIPVETDTGNLELKRAGYYWRDSGVTRLLVCAPLVLKRLLKEYRTFVSDVYSAIGPAAGGCCYEVGSGGGGAIPCPLARANRDQLIREGVDERRIYTAPFCTICRTVLFFSYRREKITHGRVGRLLSVIGRP